MPLADGTPTAEIHVHQADAGSFAKLRRQTVSTNPAKARNPAQNARTRLQLRTEYEDALAVVGRIEAEAGPTLQVELGKAKRVQGAYQIWGDRQLFIRRRLGHRSGLYRLMQLELGTDPAVTDRAKLYAKLILQISANVAALSGSDWPSVRSWLKSRLPMMMAEMESALTSDFFVYVFEARIDLAERITSGDPDLHTGPSPADIAEGLNITTEQLRQAKASKCGLTSIDPQDRRTRDRERQERKRREAGVRPQAERNAKAEMKALADRLGCNISTIYRKRREGTLDAFIAGGDQDDTDLSAIIIDIDEGHIGITNDNLKEDAGLGIVNTIEVKAPGVIVQGYSGRNLRLDQKEIARLGEKFPHLRGRVLDHLAEVDRRMNTIPRTSDNRVLHNLFRHWNRAAGKAKLKEAQPEENVPSTTGLQDGFNGKHITVDASFVEAYGERFPHLRDDLHGHLVEIDGMMRKTTAPYQRRVLQNNLRDRNRSVGKAKAQRAA